MDLAQLTQEMHKFVQEMGWYEPGTKKPQTPKNIAISLSLEAAEVLEHFQWGEEPSPDLPQELADVLLYLLQLASVLQIDLEAATLAKLRENYTRWGPRS